MSIIKNALKKQICDSNRQQYNDTTATIIEYDITMNTAKIKYANPNGDGYLYRDNVRLSNTLGGVTGAGIYPGQSCTISFINNNIYSPIITGIISNNYSNKTCSDQGAYLVDNEILSYNKPEEITPMINNWIEEDNTDSSKYNNDLGDYTETDVSELIHETLNTLDKYKSTEQGITNLSTKSTIKLKENGDIDIFIANNIGIRISLIDKSINLYGTLKINGQEIDLSKILNDTYKE